MNRHICLVALCAGLMLGNSTAEEPSETLTVKDSEHPDALMNTGQTHLRMTTTTSEDNLKKGEKCEVKVELHNPSAYIEVVYMPALRLMPVFVPDKKDLHPDEYGPPVVHGRMCAKDERLNYVVLMGGDSYCRTYSWTAPDIGHVSFQAVYLNEKNGKDIGVLTWTGELRSESKRMRIAASEKAEPGVGR